MVQAPLEQYRKSFRQAQKIVERDLCTTFSGQLKDLAAAVAKGTKQPADSLPTIVQRLTQLKRKYDSALQEQQNFCQRTLRRLSHLNDLSMAILPPADDKENSVSSEDRVRRWNRKMIDRLLVDFMLRRGYFNTVQKVIASESLSENNDNGIFYDFELFETASQIERSLASKSCTECLAWCSENKSALRKKGSTLEFNLRLQEYIELVRARQIKEAITYARKHFTSWADTLMPKIQEAMALIAFPPFTKCDKYRVSSSSSIRFSSGSSSSGSSSIRISSS